jgi:hypothetical protein
MVRAGQTGAPVMQGTQCCQVSHSSVNYYVYYYYQFGASQSESLYIKQLTPHLIYFNLEDGDSILLRNVGKYLHLSIFSEI